MGMLEKVSEIMYSQSSLFVELHIYEFTSSLKFVCKPKINICSVLLGTFLGMHKVAEKVSHLMCMFPAEVKQGTLSLHVSALTL